MRPLVLPDDLLAVWCASRKVGVGSWWSLDLDKRAPDVAPSFRETYFEEANGGIVVRQRSKPKRRRAKAPAK